MTFLKRDDFKEAVFERDGHKCVMCGADAVDAHHIMDRALWEDGGYYLPNGVSLCSECHWGAETCKIDCETLWEKIGVIKNIPMHLNPSHRYDKWGNIILHSGEKVMGELFYTDGVQKSLKWQIDSGVFSKYVKYPKTLHLPWSNWKNDDRVMPEDEMWKNFDWEEVVVTEKLDGENATLYYDGYNHARSLDGRNHPTRNWVKNLHNTIVHDIPKGWRICGENMYARHSIGYDALESYFYVFAIYDEGNNKISFDEMIEYCDLMNLKFVPVLYRGLFDVEKLKECYTGVSKLGGIQEGYVVSWARSFHWGQHSQGMVKYVRKNHVNTDDHWMHGEIEKNGLKI